MAAATTPHTSPKKQSGKFKDVKAIGGFEPRKEALVSPMVTNGVAHYRNEKGIGSFGNLYPALVSYKMNKVFGEGFVAYMSDRYLDSDFIYEMGRGELDLDILRIFPAKTRIIIEQWEGHLYNFLGFRKAINYLNKVS